MQGTTSVCDRRRQCGSGLPDAEGRKLYQSYGYVGNQWLIAERFGRYMLGKKNADTKMSTLIGAGAELTGDFTLDGSARIDGKIGGNVTVTGNLILGAGSVVTGDVQAASVLIGGEVTGNITAPEKAELTASAKGAGGHCHKGDRY